MLLSFKKYATLGLALGVLVSCTKEIDIEIPEQTPKQVLSAYLQAGDTIEALVSTAVPFSNVPTIPLLDTTYQVELFKNGAFLEHLSPVKKQFFGDSTYYIYQSTQTAEAGARYKLVSTHPTLKTASASDRIPETPVIQNFTVDTAAKTITLTVENLKAVDYYAFRCSAIDLTGQTVNIPIASTEPNVQVDNGTDFLTAGGANFPGLRLYLKSEEAGSKQLVFFYSAALNVTANDSAVFHINRISENYYKHELSKITQEPIVPIFPEPNKLFTNVNNGFGVVAGANELKLRFNR